MFRMVDLTADDRALSEAAARILVAGFREHSPRAWPTLAAGLTEVKECLAADGGFVRVCLDEDGTALGWIGGQSQYDGRVWELHPLVVDPPQQGRGVGRALCQDFERQVAARGGTTILLGTDDETDRTSLGGVDVYPEVWRHIAALRNVNRHPFTFYQKMGYAVVGVIPDANGFGKPDILMAKRVGGGAPTA